MIKKISYGKQSINKNDINNVIKALKSELITQGPLINEFQKKLKNFVGEKYADGYGKSSHGTSWSMAKSYYAALIGISLDKGEIESLDENVSNYLDYFADERSN